MAIPVYIYVLRTFNSKHRLCRHASAASHLSLLHAAKMSAALSSHEAIHRRGMIQPQFENAMTPRSLGDKDRPTDREKNLPNVTPLNVSVLRLRELII